jgi:aspartate kinase
MITVHKFGGASVRDAASVKNAASIIKSLPGEHLVIVVSAMGKTTNALEKVLESHFNKNGNKQQLIDEVETFHLRIIDELFPSGHEALKNTVHNYIAEISWAMEEDSGKGYNFLYDQVVSVGELISSAILSACLNATGIEVKWTDARNFIRTDETWREGKILWEETCAEIQQHVSGSFQSGSRIILTQGFIGCTSENYTTTLGREGSDYTAAILAYCLPAESVTIWKDVPGVLSADPRYFQDYVRFEEISYHDAIELTYYGATVIHPKTIKPLENKNIPLYVRSFNNPQSKGTQINRDSTTRPKVPSFILKPDQILISISARDFSFIAEANLSELFSLFARHKAKINLMQNSAISFTVCLDNDRMKIPSLLEDLKKNYSVLFNEHLNLYTVRHYFPSTIETLYKEKEVLLEQRSRTTAQLVIREKTS